MPPLLVELVLVGVGGLILLATRGAASEESQPGFALPAAALALGFALALGEPAAARVADRALARLRARAARTEREADPTDPFTGSTGRRLAASVLGQARRFQHGRDALSCGREPQVVFELLTRGDPWTARVLWMWLRPLP